MSSAASLNTTTNVNTKNSSSKENENLNVSCLNSVASSNKNVLENTVNKPQQVSVNKEFCLDSAGLDPKSLLESLKNQPSSLIKIMDKNDIAVVKIFAYIVCREYLSGAWKNIEFENFNIKRIS
jgi:hypothetical protein